MRFAKLLFVLGALHFAASSSFAAFTLISWDKAQAATVNPATTGLGDTTGANLIVAIGLGYSVSACTTTGGGIAISDSKSNTWSFQQNYSTGNANICVFWTTPTSVGTNHTFTLATGLGGSYPSVFVAWFSGAASSNVKDQHSGATSSSGTTLQPGACSPTTDNQLLITGVADAASVSTRSVSPADVTPFRDNYNNNSFSTGAWSYQIQTTATSYNPTWTHGTSGLARAAVCFSFKAAAVAPTILPRRTVIMGWNPSDALRDLFGALFGRLIAG
jgi:hypothetical protein